MRLLLVVCGFVLFADIISDPALFYVPESASTAAASWVQDMQDRDAGAFASCTTDSECMEECPEEEQDLPPDDPNYCDGGPQS